MENSNGYNITKIVDRTIPEIYRCNKEIKTEDILSFCRILKDIGVDWIEICGDLPGRLGKLPEGIDFLYRIESEQEMNTCVRYGIKHCIVSEALLKDEEMLTRLHNQGINITVECRVDSMAGLHNLKNLRGAEGIRRIHTLRLTGLKGLDTSLWTQTAGWIGKMLNTAIDACPENRFYHATAVALEAVMGKMNFATVSFMGYGGRYGYAALEELLAAIKVLTSPHASINLGLLPGLGRLFSGMTGVGIPESKPVIGEGIFKYESGIHADGIEKNPATYEPFEPYMVGQQRKLHIGKHSGTKSVIRKLEELGIGCGAEEAAAILKVVREKSIQLKRSLCDEEIKELCGVFL